MSHQRVHLPTNPGVRLVGEAAVPTVLAVTLIEWLPARGVPLMAVLALLAAAMAGGAWRARHTLLSRPYRTLVPLLLLLSVGVAAASALMRGDAPFAYALAGSAGPALAGWALLFWLLAPATREGSPSPVPWDPPAWLLPLLLMATAVLLTVVHFLTVGRWAVVSDEIVYLVQSRWMSGGHYSWRVDADVAPFFQMRKLGVAPDGGLFGMYTPGWPAILALFDQVGARWWAPIVVGCSTVLVTYRLGLRLHSAAAGLLAATMLALQPHLHQQHAGYMPHPATILAIAAAALWLVEGESARGWGRTWRWLGAGMAIGIAVTVRPLTGVALGASLGLWMVLRRHMPPRTIVACALTVILGALPVAAWFLHYNYATTGDPFLLSYRALHDGGYDLGFGARGFTGIDEALRRVPIVVTFTPRDAVTHALERLAGINYGFVPYALLAPLLAVFAAHGHRPRPVVLASFLLLPALYFFYWGSEIRFYTEFLPLLLIWVAIGMLAVARHRPQLAGRLVTAVVVGSVALAIPGRWNQVRTDPAWGRSAYLLSPGRFATYAALDSLQRERGPLLLFVRERMPLQDILLNNLYFFNQDGLDGTILAVRDLGTRNAALVARFPDRTPLIVEDHGAARPASIRAFTPGDAAAH